MTQAKTIATRLYTLKQWLVVHPFIISIIWFLIAFCLRLIKIDHLSFWTDEFHTLYLVPYTLWDYFANPTLVDHPPLYFLIVRYWSFFSHGEFWIRALSAFWGALTIFPFYAMTLKLGNFKFANLAIIFLVFSPYHLEYSQEARHYTLLMLLSTMVLHALVCWQGNKNLLNRWYYIISSFLLLSTHTVGGLFLLSVNLCYILLFVRKKIDLWHWLKVQILLVVISSPVLILLFQIYFFKETIGFWQARPDGWLLLDVLNQFLYTNLMSFNYLVEQIFSMELPYIGLETYAYYPFIVLFIFFIVYIATYNDKKLLFVFSSTVLYVTILFAISFISVPIFAARTAIPALILVPVFSAFPLNIQKLGWLRNVLICLSVVCLIITGLSFYTTMKQMKKEQWRELMAYVDQQIKEDDLILHWTYITGLGVEYYADQFDINNPIIGLPQSYHDAVFTPTIGFPEDSIIAPVNKIYEQYTRVWLVQYRVTSSPLEEQLQSVGYEEIDRHSVISLDVILFEKS